MSSKYSIVGSPSRGKIVIANKNFLPGELILRESQPILKYIGKSSTSFKTNAEQKAALAVGSFNTFKKDLSPSARIKFLSFFGPTTGIYADLLRMVAKDYRYSDHDDGQYRHLTSTEVEEYVKVSIIIKLNSFGTENGCFIFAEMSRFAHSCCSNCIYNLEESSCSCYARIYIKAGEELTLSYFDDNGDSQPTHERRHQCLEYKDFTCHCPRCDAPGDDTRQFDCCDPACKGVMMACQPINNEELPQFCLPYTGVKYVEPYLLPCSLCHHVAPTTYQSIMFALETQVEDLGEQFKSRLNSVCMSNKNKEFKSLLKEIEATHFPRRHRKSLEILWTVLNIKRLSFSAELARNRTEIEHCRATVQNAAEEYMTGQENIFPYACFNSLAVLRQTCNCCIIEWQKFERLPAIYLPSEAKMLLQKTVRMHHILHGRHRRDVELDVALLKTMEALPMAQPRTDLCAFCEESPLRAALTLSRCGRCRQVAYCSVGCQKAHWKLHKKTCKDPVGK